MGEALVSELESAIADAGALVVRVQKYRRGAAPEGAALAREALALGDAARRHHRHGTLDAEAASRLLAETRALTTRIARLIAAVRDDAAYRAAVAAHAGGDVGALARLLPAIFAGLEPTVASELFAPVAWLRRGRLRPIEEVVAEIVEVRAEGLAAEADDLSPGSDPELPAVVLRDDPPLEEPIVLRIPPGTVRGPLHRLVATGEILVHVRRLRAPVEVVLAGRLALEEQLRVEIAPSEWERHRDVLAAALGGAGVPVARR